jgi:hypothetical protein
MIPKSTSEFDISYDPLTLQVAQTRWEVLAFRRVGGFPYSDFTHKAAALLNSDPNGLDGLY